MQEEEALRLSTISEEALAMISSNVKSSHSKREGGMEEGIEEGGGKESLHLAVLIERALKKVFQCNIALCELIFICNQSTSPNR